MIDYILCDNSKDAFDKMHSEMHMIEVDKDIFNVQFLQSTVHPVEPGVCGIVLFVCSRYMDIVDIYGYKWSIK